MQSHREAVTKLIIENDSLRAEIEKMCGLTLSDEKWPQAAELLVWSLDLYDGSKLRPDWRERMERGPDFSPRKDARHDS